MQKVDSNDKKRNLFSHKKMGKEVLIFGYIEIEEDKFYCHKSPIFKRFRY